MVTLIVNWLVKPSAWPSSRAFHATCVRTLIDAETARITPPPDHLAAAPLHRDGVCLVLPNRWRSGLYPGEVAVNDRSCSRFSAPIVMFLCGDGKCRRPTQGAEHVRHRFIVVPLTRWLTRIGLLKSRGKEWFEKNFLSKFDQ